MAEETLDPEHQTQGDTKEGIGDNEHCRALKFYIY